MYVPAVTSTVTMLDVSNNHLLPEGIKHVCTALRTCTAMRELDLSYKGGEELRLQLLKLVAALVPRCGAALAPHLPELVQILVMAFADPFPDAKKEGSEATRRSASMARAG